MIALYILFALIVVSSLLLLSSVCVRFSFDETVLIRVSVLGVRLYFYNSGEQNKPTKNKKINSGKDETKKLKDSVKKYVKTKNVFELVSEAFPLILAFLKKLKITIERLRFKNVIFDLKVATPDAAQTAILYGKLCSVISPVVVLLSENLSFECDRVSVTTDFLSESSVLKSSGVVKLRIIHIVSLALTSAWTLIKMKIGEVKYVRK